MSWQGWYWQIHMAQGGVQLGEEAVCFCGFERGFHYVAGLRSDLEHLSCTSTHLHSQQTTWSEQSKDSAGAFALLAHLTASTDFHALRN